MMFDQRPERGIISTVTLSDSGRFLFQNAEENQHSLGLKRPAKLSKCSADSVTTSAKFDGALCVPGRNSMTTIDPSKVNLLEADIEDWLYENPQAIRLGPLYYVDRWVARQLKVHSGIIDLVGITNLDEMHYKYIVVVEVKNVEINAAALTQVCRYAYDVHRAIETETVLFQCENWGVLKVVIGPSISDQTLREAEAIGITAKTFGVSLSLSVSGVSWNGDYRNKRSELYRDFRDEPFVGRFVRSVIESNQTKDNDAGNTLIPENIDAEAETE